MAIIDIGNCTTNLYLTKPRLNKLVTVIKNLRKVLPALNKNLFTDYASYGHEFKGDDYDFVYFGVYIKKDSNKRLDELFGCEPDGILENRITFEFEQDNRNKKYWRFMRAGRPLCGKRYQEVIDGKERYDTCPCPHEVKEFCKYSTKAVKKLTLKTEEKLFGKRSELVGHSYR
ncbi:MAG: hypothetical protein PHS34_08035 [Candidatus Omnitrophica bacterium]|nr:hypothetical protein [Candidatus Nanoarchaeia archaeon]MDD5551192.1 hypothetical protein [Candidatus Omnitrophota bacterium]